MIVSKRKYEEARRELAREREKVLHLAKEIDSLSKRIRQDGEMINEQRGHIKVLEKECDKASSNAAKLRRDILAVVEHGY